MRAMVLSTPGAAETGPLQLVELPVPKPGPGDVLIRVEVVGRVERSGSQTGRFRMGDRVGAAWLHASCGGCPYCRREQENLCDAPRFTGYDVNGGYAEYMVAPEAFVYPIPEGVTSREAAPFLCAGIIGYRALCRSAVRKGEPLGLYGFGASAHIVLQVARHWGCEVYVCTRGARHQELARRLGATWVGAATER